MTAPVGLHRYSFQDYLAVEQISTIRHEYLNGEIYAMAGGSILHAGLSAAVLASLHAQLGGRCRVYSSDLRIRVRATGLATYPDVTIVCGSTEADPDSADTLVNPTVVVEVLWPSTVDYDLGEKFEHYRRIPSLQAVLYVAQDQRRLELRARATDGSWSTTHAGPNDALEIAALACFLSVDRIYDDAGAPK
jgi:Uma2 family endonuclease